ncbi:MAG: DnaJ domain-containing protein [Desulfobacteraceae bacterium]|nr:DnaJ domain-containing protein [Desulfobacteraceae bacterium]
MPESEILAAFQILFPPHAENSREILLSIEQPEIQRAYRKRALQTHPDRFASRGVEYQKMCAERFIQVNNAYELLNNYLKSRDSLKFIKTPGFSGIRQEFHKRPNGPSSPRRPAGFSGQSYWQTEVPRRHLRFGEFLYFSRAIPWRSLIQALVWQNKQRPRLGEIGQRWGWMTEFQIGALLRRKRVGERIGELLLNHGLITPFQLRVLLWQQRKIQRPIGEYFIEQRLLNPQNIADFLRRQQRHNFDFLSGSMRQ